MVVVNCADNTGAAGVSGRVVRSAGVWWWLSVARARRARRAPGGELSLDVKTPAKG
jgi:hypothetical protein